MKIQTSRALKTFSLASFFLLKATPSSKSKTILSALVLKEANIFLSSLPVKYFLLLQS